MNYQPPCTITTKIIDLISKISEQLGRLAVLDDEKHLKLRRINRIRTIQGSLAIEGNTLSEDQITAILNGQPVIAPPKEILEAQNAIKAYELFEIWQPSKQQDLLFAHQVLMAGLVTDAGHYRNGNVGVMNGKQVIHMAPQTDRVPQLMADLLAWLQQTDMHPLIASSVFHYEFEFIHPFSDGNGRMGRLWQTLILSKWSRLLAQLPVESMIHQHQTSYYQAINISTQKASSESFVEFMLEAILNTLSISSDKATPQVTPQVKMLLNVLFEQKQGLDREQFQSLLSLKDRKSFRERYLKPALVASLIEMTIPDKPNSKLQQYRLTELGLALLG
jgi:Fic family protein